MAGGEDFFGAVDFAGEIGGFVDADLKLAVEAGVVAGEGEAGAAAGTGEEALQAAGGGSDGKVKRAVCGHGCARLGIGGLGE